MEDESNRRIAELERQVESLLEERRATNRPDIQVIQRVEHDSGQKKVKKATNPEAERIMAWGCAIAMVIFMLLIALAGSCG